MGPASGSSYQPSSDWAQPPRPSGDQGRQDGYAPANDYSAPRVTDQLVPGPGSFPPSGRGDLASRVQLDRQPTRLRIIIPPNGVTGNSAFLLLFTIVWNVAVVYIFSSLITQSEREWTMALFAIPFVGAGAWLIWLSVKAVAMGTGVFINETDYHVEWRIAGKLLQQRTGRTYNIQTVRVNTIVSRQEESVRDSNYYHNTRVSYSTTDWLEIVDTEPSRLPTVIQVINSSSLSKDALHCLARDTSEFLAGLPNAAGGQQSQPGGPSWGEGGRGGGQAAIPDSWVPSS
eukprot:TRINITY_DN161_c0_g1_i1.p1 TRINITY_DN161_c0_g1~~TRINITY_DN161_c0_g1_i1.p1  ORF type:complete len:287 (-),score=29.67 TRINITY_DN161_c0_g1_i1:247-1107(-)